jgi:hypothetical protein
MPFFRCRASAVRFSMSEAKAGDAIEERVDVPEDHARLLAICGRDHDKPALTGRQSIADAHRAEEGEERGDERLAPSAPEDEPGLLDSLGGRGRPPREPLEQHEFIILHRQGKQRLEHNAPVRPGRPAEPVWQPLHQLEDCGGRLSHESSPSPTGGTGGHRLATISAKSWRVDRQRVRTGSVLRRRAGGDDLGFRQHQTIRSHDRSVRRGGKRRERNGDR